jgi:hypothetical protein
LESLIFYAIAKAAQEYVRQNVVGPISRHTVNTYGDDIICPKYSSTLTIKLLKICGFETNEKKSFTEGPFRESCGGHFFNGIDISPFYIRKPVDTVSRMIWLLNTLKRYLEVDGIADLRTQSLWLKLKRKYVPRFLWGGKNSFSVCALHTYDEPRLLLTRTEQKRDIDGIPAILRNFQFNNKVISFNDIMYQDYGVRVEKRAIPIELTLRDQALLSVEKGNTPSTQYERDIAEMQSNDLMLEFEEDSGIQIVNMRLCPKLSVKRNFTNEHAPVYYPIELGATG